MNQLENETFNERNFAALVHNDTNETNYAQNIADIPRYPLKV